MSAEENREAFLCPGSPGKKVWEWPVSCGQVLLKIGEGGLRADNMEVTSDTDRSGLREGGGTSLVA